MAKGVSDTVTIEGILERDSAGNLVIHPDKDNALFQRTGYYTNGNEGYRKLAEDAFFKRGKREGDLVKYVCAPVDP